MADKVRDPPPELAAVVQPSCSSCRCYRPIPEQLGRQGLCIWGPPVPVAVRQSPGPGLPAVSGIQALHPVVAPTSFCTQWRASEAVNG